MGTHPGPLLAPAFGHSLYTTRAALLARGTGARFDLADEVSVFLPLASRFKSRGFLLGVVTASTRWQRWDNERLTEIEERIRYDLEFDLITSRLSRMSTPGGPCSTEYLWRLRVPR